MLLKITYTISIYFNLFIFLISEPLTLETTKKFKDDFYAHPKNELAQNACTRTDPFEIAISRRRTDATLHVYNIKVIYYNYT